MTKTSFLKSLIFPCYNDCVASNGAQFIAIVILNYVNFTHPCTRAGNDHSRHYPLQPVVCHDLT